LTPEQRLLDEYRKLSKFQIVTLYKRQEVDTSKVEVLKAFTLDLINQIYDTFLGNDMINNERDIIAHYTWCYNQVSEKYRVKWYKFEENPKLKEYFHAYFVENIYALEESKQTDIEHFNFLFNYEDPKEKFEVEAFLYLYSLFILTPRSGRILTKR
jgi:hypothetical protein